MFSGYFKKIEKFKLLHIINGLSAQPLIGSMDRIGQSSEIKKYTPKDTTAL